MAKKGFFAEFKEFISRGNVMDMAVGVIIGGAFQSIINSLVNDVVMPVLSVITGGTDFSAWSVTLVEADEAAEKAAVMLNYGNFISAVINFLLMALVIFTFIRILNKVTATLAPKKEEEPAAPTTKVCPYCLSEIPLEAKKCAHCTSDVE